MQCINKTFANSSTNNWESSTIYRACINCNYIAMARYLASSWLAIRSYRNSTKHGSGNSSNGIYNCLIDVTYIAI